MLKADFEKLNNDMKEKLGKENTALIADHIATLVSDNVAVNELISKKDAEIERLKNEKENLISTNGRLLQKISMGCEENRKTEDKKEEVKEFNFRSVFDEYGRFKI